MDETLLYSLAAGLGIVILIVFARFAFRWFIRLVVVGVILVVLGGAAWVWMSSSPGQSETTRTRSDNSKR